MFTRKYRDFKDRELALVREWLPHSAHAYRYAEAVSRQRLAFEEELGVLERQAHASVLLIRDLKIVAASADVQSMLDKYFGNEPLQGNGSGLPDLLARWVSCTVAAFRVSVLAARPATAARGCARRRTADHQARCRFTPEAVALVLEEETGKQDSAPLEAALGLSRREAQVLFRVASGKTSSEAATIFALIRRTIDKHLESILQKLGVETPTAASALAWKILHRLPIGAERPSEHR